MDEVAKSWPQTSGSAGKHDAEQGGDFPETSNIQGRIQTVNDSWEGLPKAATMN